MNLPFTASQFLDVFGRYNAALWPAAAALWIASAVIIAIGVRRGAMPDRALSGLLAALWAWSGVAYHAAFFTGINPAAWGFAALFLVQAFLFLRLGVLRRDLRFRTAASARHVAAVALIAIALAYPFINLVQGLRFPRMPTFGVPCPTTIFTVGLLLTADRPSWKLAVIPIGWSLIAGSAALRLGIYADVVLPAAAVLLGASLIGQGRHGSNAAGAPRRGLQHQDAAITARPPASPRTRTPARSSRGSTPSSQ